MTVNTGFFRRMGAICLMAAMIGAGCARADAVVVTAERLNIRSEATADSRAVTVVSAGETLKYVCEADDWIMVSIGSKTGYVMKKYVDIDDDKIMVGGESAGGGLTAALCMLARDRGTVKIAYQFPLYPMLSNRDTESSRDNHGRVWNTRRNHLGWRFYLRGNAKKRVSPYASPIHQKDFSNLPSAYTFVGSGEPFYAETLAYIQKLTEAGVEAEVDVYPSDCHAFDILDPESEVSRQAIRTFEEKIEKVVTCRN